MGKEFLMGNEAMGLGAVRAGVQVVAGYPGTPSTEVLETIAKHNSGAIYVEWSVNEKAGMEVAAAAAYAGARSLVTMKQVGLNVASDPLMSLAYVGVKGGMVVLVADDPGPISSQTEQDTRHFAQFSKLPIFDPSSPEEAYLMIGEAFEYSEKYHTPVIFRPTTRVCHGCAAVELLEPVSRPAIEGFRKDSSRWVIFPRLSFANHKMIEGRLPQIGEDFSAYPRNMIHGGAKPLGKGIVTHGASYEYVMEALRGYDGVRIVKISTPFPRPERLLLDFAHGLSEILAVEELDPVLEQELLLLAGRHHLSYEVKGKLTGEIPPAGENTVASVRAALLAFLGEPFRRYLETREGAAPELEPAPALPVRPPVLCAGCPHRASFYAVKQAVFQMNSESESPVEAVYCGDIGCYTLGNAKPLDMVDTCLCMGAGITMAQGLQRVEPEKLYFSFVGDSTFFASGMTGIVNAVYNQANLTLCILDNSTTAMTGHQPHPGTGCTAMGQIVDKISIVKVLEGLGVQEIVTVDPLNLQASVETVKRLSALPGVKAVIFKSPCIAMEKSRALPCAVNQETCIGCETCIKEIGCPGLVLTKSGVHINGSLCTGCGLCAQICPVQAIEEVGN